MARALRVAWPLLVELWRFSWPPLKARRAPALPFWGGPAATRVPPLWADPCTRLGVKAAQEVCAQCSREQACLGHDSKKKPEQV